MRRFCLTAIILMLLSSAASADLPKPQGWVSDYAGIIDRENASRIADAIGAIKNSTGAEAAVITRNSLEEFGSIEEMGLAYLKGWGIGQKGKDNGLVILVVIDNSVGYRRYRFETGLGLEGDLPDGLLGEIGRDELMPRFINGDYGEGILASIYRIGGILGADMSAIPVPKKVPGRKKGIGSLLFFMAILFLLGGRGRRSGLLPLLLFSSLGGFQGRSGGFGGGGFGGGGFGGFGGGGGGAGGGATGGW